MHASLTHPAEKCGQATFSPFTAFFSSYNYSANMKLISGAVKNVTAFEVNVLQALMLLLAFLYI